MTGWLPDRVRTAREVVDVARSAMEQIFTAAELATATAQVEEPPPYEHGRAPDPDGSRVLPEDERIVRGEYWIRITAVRERTYVWYAPRSDETDAELFARIRSQLQDFVAESTFGWGQLRP